ncbi:MAG: hypothetical protein DMF68_00085 [Acidobacteria bacterium]|nr:MAG: hypothetical protein DMF68_00085 [Acidobacteriota bacterium]
MNYSTTARRTLSYTIALIILLSGFAPSSFAQRRRRVARSAEPVQRTLPHHLPQGTLHTRAPRTFDVLNYTIRTRFDVPNRTVIGDETVTLKPLASGFKSFDLDASSMKIETVTLGDSNTMLQWTQPPDKLSIALDRAYGPTDSISIRIRYRATPHKGIYFIQQTRGGSEMAKPAQIWSQGEPEENHYWFPCYDFPDDKATSEQYITTSADQIAISNGSLLETINNPDGSHTFHWKMDEPHSSYLISLVVGNYAKLTDTYKNIPVEYYTYPGTEQQARNAFSKTPEMIRLFSEKLNYEFPFNRYAQTIVANFIFGGMENITATTHADTEILGYSGTKETAVSTTNLISHELAHSWFGDLVTCKDWSQAWLNEGFATFMEAVFREHEAGREAYMAEMHSNMLLYFLEDSFRYRRPIVYDRYRQPIDLFDSTLYKKGALILHMLREEVGDEMFWNSLNKYLNENKDKVVQTSDLEHAFEETTGKKLDWFFDQWVYKAGYPELRVRSFYNAATHTLALNIAQTQLPEAMTPAVFRLPVDIEFETAKGKRTEHILINERQQRFSFKLDSKPVAINFDKDERILKKLDFPQQMPRPAFQVSGSRRRVYAGMYRVRTRLKRASAAAHGILP